MARREEFFYDASDEYPAYDECEFPKYPRRPHSKRGHYFIWAAIWLCLIALAGFHITSLVIAILGVTTDNDGFDTGAPGYTLYKNTRFESCFNKPPEPYYNCTSVYEDFKNLEQAVFKQFQYHGIGVLATAEHIPVYNDTEGTWCEALSCFNNFKVVPSKPRESALWQVTIADWISAAGTLLVAVWHTRTVYKASAGSGPECGRLAWDDWLGTIYDAASLVWWWVGFGWWSADQTRYPRPSVLGWISPWKYSDLLAYHPFVCGIPLLRNRPTALRFTRWILRVIAAVQWLVGAHIFSSLHADSSGHPVYDCLASQIQEAPGFTSCTAQQICSKDWLFHSPRFIWAAGGGIAVEGLLAAFLTCTLVAIIPPLLIPICMITSNVLSSEYRSLSYWKKLYHEYHPGAPVAAAVGSICVIVMAVLSIKDIRSEFQRERDGAVSFYWECTALNVNVSPWRHYMDVDDGLVVRFAKMFFNS
ncbi:hypothetical protein ASPCAL00482 [Aspergillus calidoustus]|uniref:Uncharacterized protein n=1 Tax=Aspergillus calidoustus TaxID=454130 RepID=A0A0U5C152_ASPCI|nr:hypothetical protein ASPCAL00482 [Aspergillus calidoustus]